MSISAKDVAELRKLTGAGMMDAKRALEEVGGDTEKAIDHLRKTGGAKAAKKAGRETKEGRVHAYIHANGKVGALVEVLCETDFVSRNEAYGEICQDLALHIVASDPLYVTRDQVPPEVIEKEREIYTAEMKEQGKPDDVIEKIVEGKMKKYFQEVVLMEQAFVKNEDMTIEEYMNEKVLQLGENIKVRRFARFTLGV